jgi:hypothetical protein
MILLSTDWLIDDDADKELASRALGGVAPHHGRREPLEIGPGDVAFIPANHFHYIASTSDESLDFLVFFGDIEVPHIDPSQTFDYVPREVLAASFEIEELTRIVLFLLKESSLTGVPALAEGDGTPAPGGRKLVACPP